MFDEIIRLSLLHSLTDGASCGTICNQSQPHRINEQEYHQDLHPEVGKPNAFIPSEDFTHVGFMFSNKFRLFGTVICQY